MNQNSYDIRSKTPPIRQIIPPTKKKKMYKKVVQKGADFYNNDILPLRALRKCNNRPKMNGMRVKRKSEQYEK